MRAPLLLPILCSLLPLACGRPTAEAPQPRPTPLPTLTPTRISRPTTGAEKARALATAVDLANGGRCAEAVPLLRVLLDAYPEMEDYHLHFFAVCQPAGSDGATAAATRLLADHPRSVYAPAAALALGSELRRRGEIERAESLLRRAAGGEDVEVAHAARFELAEIAKARGDYRSAHAAMSALREQAGGDIASRARTAVAELRRAHPDLAPRSAAEMEDEFDLLLREGEAGEALRLIDKLLAAAGASERPRLLRRRAAAELAAGDTEAHLRTLRQVHERYPSSAQAPEALFQEARWLWNRDRDAEAQAAFLELERRYPRSPHIATARYALGRIAHSAGDRPQALSRYQSVVDRHPGSKLAADSRWQMAWIRYYDGQWEAAARQFAQLAGGQATAQAADAVYWRARALERGGNANAARELYRTVVERAPDSYYAGLAGERLGQPSTAASVAVAAPRQEFPALPAAMRDDYHIARAAELHRARLMTYARREVRAYLRDHPPPPRDLLIALYQAVDNHREAIRLGKSGTRVLYPFAFWSLVAPQAERYRVDPLLVISLMRQESLFDSEARSPANARGLMQLLPSTADEVAMRIGRTGSIDLYDPATNIELGIAHLRELADRYGGDRVRILAAYNAGADAVDKWDRRFADRPLDEYVESITYRETRDYVKKVLGNYRTYLRLIVAEDGTRRTVVQLGQNSSGGNEGPAGASFPQSGAS